jgi:alpha-D-xyloside xylohydrolase
MSVYLPAGARWTLDTKEFAGGQTVEVECPIEVMPVFVREGREALEEKS